MDINLSALEIRILLKCDERPLVRGKLTQVYKKSSIEEREKAINNLKARQYIVQKALPKPSTRTVPIFYEITDKGRAWVKEYMATYHR